MRNFLLFLCLITSFGLFAQPANDDCAGIIDLGEGISCTGDFYNNVGATASMIFTNPTDNIPNCWNTVNNDVWFMFTVPANGSIIDYTITINGVDDGMGNNAMTNPQIALYRGDCTQDNLAELLCESADLNETSVSIDAALLTPTVPYFIRVDNYSASGTVTPGAFQVCVDSIKIENNIDDGSTTACAGTLYDSGGPNGEYSSNENNVFTICPAEFHQSIQFTMEYYNTESTVVGFDTDILDYINFYDGPNTSSPFLAQLAGGGTCFQTCASSGCLTVEFISDDILTLEGFMGFWECSLEPCPEVLTLVVEDNIPNQEIVNAVASPLTQVTIDTIICEADAYGTFQGAGTGLGLEQGLLLSSGMALEAVGPNEDFSVSTSYGAPGDADLDYLSELSGNGFISRDACIVELDVFVNTTELTFEYIFASEEYPEYVDAAGGFNDIFAFLASGPGIVGDPMMNNQENIAIVPGTNIPVEIFTVNGNSNWEYYRDNLDGLSIAYDGLTSDFPGGKKSLTANIQTIPCNTYHLKLAIADRGDDALDSAVFVSDIKAGVPTIASNFASGLDYLIEDCVVGQDELVISIDEDAVSDSITYTVVISGTAQQGVDYGLNIPSTITFIPGATSFAFPITVTPDGLIEGAESILISLTSDFGCGVVQAATFNLAIEDAPVVEINSGADTVFVCATSGTELIAMGAQFYFWEPVSVFDDPSSNMPVANITQSQWVTVTGTVANCVDVDSVFLQLVDPEVTIVPQSDTNVCEGTAVVLEAVNNVNGVGLMWTPNADISSSTDEIVTITPQFSQTYTATIQISGCMAQDEINLNVDPFDFPVLTTLDTLICQGEPLVLAEELFATSTVYEWTPDDELIPDGTVANPTLVPQESTVLTLTATSASGFCSQTAEVNVEVLPADIVISQESPIFVCAGESATVNAATTNGEITWSSSDPTVNGSTSLSFTTTPTESHWYYATMNIGNCIANDSIFIRVDSLPAMDITLVPDGAPYCPGQIITLVAPTYESFNFPDIEHQWAPPIGAESELDDYNLVISALETTTYVRTTINNACSETNEILVEVIDPTIFTGFSDTLVCPGEAVQLLVTNDNDIEEVMWSPGTGLSCTDCLDPIATVFATTQYTVTAEVEGCPGSAMVSVQIRNAPGIFITSDPPGGEIPQGEDVTLMAEASAGPDGTYEWFLNGVPLGLTGQVITTTVIDTDNTYEVNIIDEFGCIGTGELFIKGTPPLYGIPSAFTPDGDGINDVFSFLTEGNVEMEIFQIYNRWGQKVFETGDVDTGWDGRFKGTMAASDVYVYVIKFNLPGRDQQILKGDVTLIR